METAIIGSALVIGYFAMGLWVIWYENKRPVFMPFNLFIVICSLGKKAKITDLPEGMDGLTKMAFEDENYRQWFKTVIDSGSVTRMQSFCFNQKRKE